MRLSIAKKIILGFGVIILFTIIGSLFTYNSLNTVGKDIDRFKEYTDKAIFLSDLQRLVGAVVMPANDYIITGNKKYQSDFEAVKTDLNNQIEKIDGLKLKDDELKQIKKMQELLKDLYQISYDIFNFQSPVGNMQAAGKMEEMDYKYGGPVANIVLGLNESIKSEIEILKKSSSETKAMAIRMLFVVAVVVVVLSILLSIFFSHNILSSIKEVLKILREIASGSGDLSKRINVKSNDEMGEMAGLFNEFIEKVSNIVKDIVESSKNIGATSGKLSSSSSDMAKGAENQNSQAVQIATAMEEMSATVTEVAKSSTFAANSSNEASRAAISGGEIVENTISEMNKIASSFGKLSELVSNLGRSSGEIGEIISVIDDIADQTNLLALNAAIEAARAGEQGRGFAVVADEVRKLAERTSSATKEISGMIKAIQTETNNAVTSMNTGLTEIELGVEQANQAGGSLKNIVETVKNTSDMIHQIATAAEEQSVTSREIVKNVENIAQISKEVVTEANSSGELIKNLNLQFVNLQKIVNQFKV